MPADFIFVVAKSHIACKIHQAFVFLIATSSLSYQTIWLETTSEAKAIYTLEPERLQFCLTYDLISPKKPEK